MSDVWLFKSRSITRQQQQQQQDRRQDHGRHNFCIFKSYRDSRTIVHRTVRGTFRYKTHLDCKLDVLVHLAIAATPLSACIVRHDIGVLKKDCTAVIIRNRTGLLAWLVS